MRNNTIFVPDVPGKTPEAVETLFSLLHKPFPQASTTLSLAPVNWILPYRAVSLLGICRYLKKLTDRPICLTGLQTSIHAYLRRIDFFNYDPETVYTLDPFNPSHELSRSLASTNVLELFPIRAHEDVYTVATRARHIFRYWLGTTSNAINNIVTLLSEACSNIVDHSGDTGIVTVQKYERSYGIDVELAISDLGMGIRRSFLAKHGRIIDTCGWLH